MPLSREGLDVSPSRQSGVSFTCKRICRVPRARNSEREVEERKVWGRTFNLLRIEGARFVFLDESGFNVNMSRGRGYARVSETPECYVPSKGPNISVMAAMSPELGVIHETHRGGVTAALFAKFLDRLFPILHRVYKEAPVVLVMDNAVIHKTSRKEGVDVPEKIGEAGFFHLYAIPYSPQLNAIESLFAQVKSHVLHEFICAPERREDIESVIGEAFRKVEQGHVEAYCRHQECNVTSCVAGIPLVSNDVILDFKEMEEGLEEESERDQEDEILLQSIKRYNRLKKK